MSARLELAGLMMKTDAEVLKGDNDDDGEALASLEAECCEIR